jgi:hypothetical protein
MSQEQVGDVAHAAGARIHELMTRHATLEEAFLDATGMSEEFVGSVQERPQQQLRRRASGSSRRSGSSRPDAQRQPPAGPTQGGAR